MLSAPKGLGGEALHGYEGFLDRRIAMIRADAEAFGNDKLRLHTDAVEQALEAGFDMLEGCRGRALAIEATAGEADDHALTLDQAFRTVGGILESLAGNGDAIDPGLELAGDAEVV